MSRLWRTVSITLAAAGVVGGTLLMLGTQKNGQAQLVQLEQSRVEVLARTWESRLEVARAGLRDQAMRHGLLRALDQTDEWSQERVRTKFEAMRGTWGRDCGQLRALALVAPDGWIHTVSGDTARLREILRAVAQNGPLDLVLLPADDGHPAVLGLCFHSSPGQDDARSGTLLALVDPASVLGEGSTGPRSWVLLAGPESALLSSRGLSQAVTIAGATWPLLLAEGAGTVPQGDGGTLCFARVQVPGMKPMLLVEPVRPNMAAVGALGILLTAASAAALLGLVLWRRRTPAQPAEPTPVAVTDSSQETSGLRQVFQTIEDPLCVVDARGLLIRANRAAHARLPLKHSRPDDTGMAVCAGEEWLTLSAFFTRASEDPAGVEAVTRIVAEGEESAWRVSTHRLYRDETGHGPTLIHFHPIPQPDDAVRGAQTAGAQTACTPDSHSPYPILTVNEAGIITGYNAAALRTCPRLADSPLLSDVLPALCSSEIARILTADSDLVFESLFGSGVHGFVLVRDGQSALLYGHPLSSSQKMEIAMQQAQECFNTLCALSPAPVLMVDSRDHTIVEANAAAADLFRTTPAGLRNQPLASLAAEPWEFGGEDGAFLAATFSGNLVPCTLRYELVKTEGVPTLLVVLERSAGVSLAPEAESAPEEAHSLPEPPPPAPMEKPPLPLGPGMLVTINPVVREVARRLFDKMRHPVEAFSSLDDATVWLITHDVRPELVALDLSDFDDANTWLSEVRARCGHVPCIGFTEGETFVLPDDGPNRLLEKPFDLDALGAALAAAGVEAVDRVTA